MYDMLRVGNTTLYLTDALPLSYYSFALMLFDYFNIKAECQKWDSRYVNDKKYLEDDKPMYVKYSTIKPLNLLD